VNFTFRRKRISGLLTVVPANERSFVESGVCVSDLAVFGLQHLFDLGLLNRDEIDALFLVTQSPDHFMPPTSNIIQGRLGLKQDVFCLDISQGCAGFVIGLIQAFLLLEQDHIRKVVLINADVLSRKASPKDRNIYPLIGDGASITVLERDTEDSVIHANLKMDGSRAEALIIPAGGLRIPSTSETARLEEVGDNNLRAKDHLFMDGAAIFNFVQVEVPPLIESLLARARISMDSVDYFFCHQPNRFMLEKLADKMKIPHDKMPNNVVEHFGNNSGATIPTAITFNLRERLLREKLRVCLAGFGAGLTWSAMLISLGNVDFNTIIEYK